jgi:hypothetical protein
VRVGTGALVRARLDRKGRPAVQQRVKDAPKSIQTREKQSMCPHRDVDEEALQTTVKYKLHPQDVQSPALLPPSRQTTHEGPSHAGRTRDHPPAYSERLILRNEGQLLDGPASPPNQLTTPLPTQPPAPKLPENTSVVLVVGLVACDRKGVVEVL